MFSTLFSRLFFPRIRRNRSDRRRSGPNAIRIPRDVAAESLEDRQLLTADIVLEWNNLLIEAIRNDHTAPPVAARALAIVQTAVFDAVNSIDRQYTPYLTMVDVHPNTSREAAVVSAAYETLIALFPAQSATFADHRTASLAKIPDGRAETDGIDLGKVTASQILAHRASDGASTQTMYTSGTSPGDWQSTPPAFAAPLLPNWPDVTPWTMSNGTQFRPAAPPAMTSAQYVKDLNQVRTLGAATSTLRTPDQTEIAHFWANGPGTSTPPGHWNVIAQIVAKDKHNTLEENARLLALLNLALADAAVCSWDAKYQYDFWRPITAIRNADMDGNPKTTADPAWTPLLITPAFPTYTSGHSTFSGAAAAVLASFFGSDRAYFVLPSETSGVASRSFRSFSQAANESGISRVYGGIHFNFDNTAGLTTGNNLGRHVATTILKREHGMVSARLVGAELLVNGTSRADVIRMQQRAGILTVTANGRSVGTFSTTTLTRIVVAAGDGNDIVDLTGVSVRSEIYGGRGSDLLIGGEADDEIFGEDGQDHLFGRSGNDRLDGGAGRNVLFGGPGNDFLTGIRGRDLLFGGRGLDELLWRPRR